MCCNNEIRCLLSHYETHMAVNWDLGSLFNESLVKSLITRKVLETYPHKELCFKPGLDWLTVFNRFDSMVKNHQG